MPTVPQTGGMLIGIGGILIIVLQKKEKE